MRRLLWLTIAGAVLYGGYWAVASRAVLRGAEAALGAMKAEGIADYAGLSLAGFPSRFDMTIDRPALASRDGWLGWSAPFLQLFALSYRPNHVIAVWPDEQTVTLGPETVVVTADDLRASAVFGASAALPLDHAQAVGRGMTLRSRTGWGLGISELRAAIRTRDAAANRHDIATDMTGLAAEGALASVAATLAGKPDAAGWVQLDTTATFDRPLDRSAAAEAVRMMRLEVNRAQVTLGRFDLSGTGELAIGIDGVPEGRIDLHMGGWQGLPDALAGLGLVSPEVAPTLRNAMAAMAAADPAGRLALPLVLTGGMMSLGPVPLGPAPRF